MIFALTLSLVLSYPAAVYAASETAVSLTGDEFGEKKAAKIGADAKVSTGYYILYPSCSATRAASIAGGSAKSGANALLKKYRKRESQVFYVRALGGGLYSIRNLHSGKYLEAQGGGTTNKTNVRQATSNGNYSQRWYITKKSGKYVFQSAVSKKVLSVKGSKDRESANLYLYTYRAKTGQKWTLKKYAGTSSSAKGKWQTSSRIWNDKTDYKILGNIIGADATGQRAIPNGNSGIGVFYMPNTVIGDEEPGSGNTISGNTQHGVTLSGDLVRRTQFSHNRIGTAATTDDEIRNEGIGILFRNTGEALDLGTLRDFGNFIPQNRRSVVIRNEPAQSDATAGEAEA